MRCPKCGFISFDHLTSCAKCGKDIAEVASELQGTSIKVETPMFLNTALASFAERESTFEEQAMEAEADAGIDFAMEETGSEEGIQMGGAAEDIDFSFEAEEEGVGAGPAAGTEETSEYSLEAEAAPEASDQSFEELDFMGAVEEEDEGGLEFDLEDFIDDMDSDKSQAAGSDDVDIDFDDKES